MKIGMLSDTHLHTSPGFFGVVKQTLRNTRSLDDLRTLLQQHFQHVDLIIHAGDFVDIAVFEMLQEFAPVEAVRGNMDSADIQRTFPVQRILEVEGFKIGITHGSGAPQGIVERITSGFAGVAELNALVFGHTHHPLNEVRDGMLLFNPGSPTDRIFAPYNSVGILEITDTISGQIIRV